MDAHHAEMEMTKEDTAYSFAATLRGIKVKGSTPTVVVVKKRWKTKSGYAIGHYRCIRIWKWVLWDRIWVARNARHWAQWSNTAHEMSHALDARLGLPRNEALAEEVERAAMRHVTSQ